MKDRRVVIGVLALCAGFIYFWGQFTAFGRETGRAQALLFRRAMYPNIEEFSEDDNFCPRLAPKNHPFWSGVFLDWRDIDGNPVNCFQDPLSFDEDAETAQTANFSTLYVSTSKRGNNVTLSCGKAKKSFKPDNLKRKHKVFTHEHEWAKYKRQGAYHEKVEVLKLIKSQGFSAKHALSFVLGNEFTYQIDKWLKDFADLKPTDAKIAFMPNAKVKFYIKKERCGYNLNRDQVFEAILDSYIEGTAVSREIERQITEAAIKATDLAKQTHYRGGFSTSYAGSSEARKHNVRLALKRFNGYVLKAGESVSFNKVVGPRTEANGFLTAKIIVGGRYEEGIGGGACQSSTTMYNAALLSDMEIIAARPHTLRVSYVEPSFDAMVNSGSSDLIFKNNTDRPVYIRTYSTDSRVGVEFYGLKMPYVIKRRYEILKRIPCDETEIIKDYEGKYSEYVKYKGERYQVMYPKEGMESKGYLRYFTPDGKFIKEVHIRTDKYLPTKGLIVEGVLERPAELPLPKDPPFDEHTQQTFILID